MTDKPFSRRDFLKFVGIATGGALFATYASSQARELVQNLKLVDNALIDPKERLTYIENHPAYVEMKRLYNEQGLPFPRNSDYYDSVSDNIKPVDKVLCYAPAEGYEEVFKSILQFSYEFLGLEASAIYLNQIIINQNSMGISAGDKTLNLFESVNSSVNIQNLPNTYPINVHEFMHILGNSKNVMALDQKLNSDLCITRAVSKNGILKTYDDIYEYGGLYCETPEEVEDDNIFKIIGQQVIANSKSILFDEDPISMKLNKIIDKNKSARTNWEFYKIGEQVLEAIKPNPENIPDLLKKIIFNVGRAESEGWAKIACVMFEPQKNNVEQSYAGDQELQSLFTKYMELTTGRSVNLDDLKNRVRNPSGNLIPYKIVIGEPQ